MLVFLRVVVVLVILVGGEAKAGEWLEAPSCFREAACERLKVLLCALLGGGRTEVRQVWEQAGEEPETAPRVQRKPGPTRKSPVAKRTASRGTSTGTSASGKATGRSERSCHAPRARIGTLPPPTIPHVKKSRLVALTACPRAQTPPWPAGGAAWARCCRRRSRTGRRAPAP